MKLDFKTSYGKHGKHLSAKIVNTLIREMSKTRKHNSIR